jgi:hypothetical protein
MILVAVLGILLVGPKSVVQRHYPAAMVQRFNRLGELRSQFGDPPSIKGNNYGWLDNGVGFTYMGVEHYYPCGRADKRYYLGGEEAESLFLSAESKRNDKVSRDWKVRVIEVSPGKKAAYTPRQMRMLGTLPAMLSSRKLAFASKLPKRVMKELASHHGLAYYGPSVGPDFSGLYLGYVEARTGRRRMIMSGGTLMVAPLAMDGRREQSEPSKYFYPFPLTEYEKVEMSAS